MPMRPLTEKELEIISKATFNCTSILGLKNAAKNKAFVKRSILDIKDSHDCNAAVVISAGPSIHRRSFAQIIVDSGFKGPIVCVDAALPYCLKNGLVPDYVVSVDESPVRIIRWYGDPDFEKREYDDYYKRKYAHGSSFDDEVKANKEYVKLVNKHAPKIKAVIGTSVDNNVARRCTEAGFDIYWWNPMYDDFEKPDSITRQAYKLVPVPAMMTGGNIGASAWVFAHSILQKIAGVIGMDLGYMPTSTMGVRELAKQMTEVFGDKAEDAFIEVYNPYIKETWYTDPTFYWYRQSFLKMLKELDAIVYNCSEGGTVFGENVVWMQLEEFLKKFTEDSSGH